MVVMLSMAHPDTVTVPDIVAPCANESMKTAGRSGYLNRD